MKANIVNEKPTIEEIERTINQYDAVIAQAHDAEAMVLTFIEDLKAKYSDIKNGEDVKLLLQVQGQIISYTDYANQKNENARQLEAQKAEFVKQKDELMQEC